MVICASDLLKFTTEIVNMILLRNARFEKSPYVYIWESGLLRQYKVSTTKFLVTYNLLYNKLRQIKFHWSCL